MLAVVVLEWWLAGCPLVPLFGSTIQADSVCSHGSSITWRLSKLFLRVFVHVCVSPPSLPTGSSVARCTLSCATTLPCWSIPM